MIAAKATRLLASPSFTFLAVLYILKRRGILAIPKWASSTYVALLILNWASLPFVWHFRVIFGPILTMRGWALLRRFGIYPGRPRGSQSRIAHTEDLTKAEYALPSVGADPFQAYSWHAGTVGFAEADYFGHMSNSVYAQLADVSRANFAVQHFAPILRYERMGIPLAGTQACFFKEIPLGASFEVESRLVTWDDRWMWALTRLTVAKNVKSSRDILVQTVRGERALCCMFVSRLCFKLGGIPGSPRPSRVYAAVGFGPDLSNWKAARPILASGRKAIRAHLSKDEEVLSFRIYDEHRAKVKDVIDRLGGGGDKAIWLELNALASQNIDAEQS